MQNEIWKDVIGYEGRYLVSNLGRIKSIYGKRSKIVKQTLGGPGKKKYLRVSLWDGINKRKTYLVHRLVAEAFLEKRDSSLTVNHKDGDKLNNHSDNLEWCTHSDNLRHSWESGLRDEQIVKMRKVVNIDTQGVFRSINQAAVSCNVPASSIYMACIGKLHTSAGFHWQFEDDYNNGVPLAVGPGRGNKVLMIDKESGEVIKLYNSIMDASRENNISRISISCCCRGKAHTAGGYKWAYA